MNLALLVSVRLKPVTQQGLNDSERCRLRCFACKQGLICISGLKTALSQSLQ
jgi:hypothetical protein